MRFVRVVGAALLLTAALAGPALAGLTTTDLSVTKTDAPDPVSAGSNITYTITLGNAPQALTAANVEVEDILPAGTTFVSATAPAGWTATTPPVGGTGTVTFTIAAVTADSSHVFTIVVNVNPATPGGTIISNTATATTTTAETNTANNTDTETTTVAAAATPTPAASLADAAMPPSTGSQQLAILGFAVLLVGVLGGSAVLAVRRART